jgi:amino acid adenylation domain-containing protein
LYWLREVPVQIQSECTKQVLTFGNADSAELKQMNSGCDSIAQHEVPLGESNVCPPANEGHADAVASLESLIRYLPAERCPAQVTTSPVEAAVIWESNETDILRQAAKDLGCNLEDHLLAGFAALLSRLTWQEIITIDLLPRFSVATFALEERISFRAGLKTVRKETFSPVRMPIRVGASYLYLQKDAPISAPNRAELRLTAKDKAGSLVMVLESASDRWAQDTLEGWLHSLRGLLLAAAKSPDAPVRLLPLGDEDALLDLYKALNLTASEYSSEAAAHELITRQVKRNPQAIAVIFGDKQLTYRELDEESSRRARYLVSIGASSNRPVAICMTRSEQLPVALLAVLKSGSCYVPLDPQHPRQRIALTLQECQPVAVLSDSAVAPSLFNDSTLISCPVLSMDEDWPEVHANAPTETSVCPDDLAYIIYTSGTTGKPKGVRIRHRSLVNLLDANPKMPELLPGDRLLAIATISFDIATMDMLLPLASGATLVIANRYAAGDAFELATLIDEHDVTFLQATPFTWRLLVNSGWSGKHDLRMISGGEALPRDLANDLLPLGRELWNCYGPTETTIYSGATRIQAESGIVPIGPPIGNTNFYVMDAGGRPVPPGVLGELYIGGVGVSPGYLLRPELTAQRFVANGFTREPEGMFFRTGDLVRLLSDGKLEFLGRLDHQVKLRGYRIELGEVESVLQTHPSVKNAAVILREDTPGEPRLVAYVVPGEIQPQVAELKEYAARSLPEYMVPARIVTLPALPLTSSGKVDRRTLPLPESLPDTAAGAHAATAGVAPENELEARILEIFREVLGEPSIGVTDSFFEYGGYSLLTARLFSRIHRVLGPKLPISLLFDAPTARGLAQIIQKGEAIPVVVPIRKEGRSAPLFVIHSYLIYAALCEAIEEERPIFGIRELNDDRPLGTLEERATVYAKEISRAYPKGPLSLAGWCGAGSLTVEVARKLREDGRVVAMVALFDSERPGYKPHVADGSSLFKAKLERLVEFHSPRLRSLDWPGKLRYLIERIEHWWESATESFFEQHRAVFRWVQRNFPFLLPETIKDRLGAVSAEDLRPSELQSYPGKIVLFRASDVLWLSGTEPSLGWSSVAKDGVEVKFAPGDHESMFREPHLPQFGRMLRGVLREGEASCGYPAA